MGQHISSGKTLHQKIEDNSSIVPNYQNDFVLPGNQSDIFSKFSGSVLQFISNDTRASIKTTQVLTRIINRPDTNVISDYKLKALNNNFSDENFQEISHPQSLKFKQQLAQKNPIEYSEAGASIVVHVTPKVLRSLTTSIPPTKKYSVILNIGHSVQENVQTSSASTLLVTNAGMKLSSKNVHKVLNGTLHEIKAKYPFLSIVSTSSSNNIKTNSRSQSEGEKHVLKPISPEVRKNLIFLDSVPAPQLLDTTAINGAMFTTNYTRATSTTNPSGNYTTNYRANYTTNYRVSYTTNIRGNYTTNLVGNPTTNIRENYTTNPRGNYITYPRWNSTMYRLGNYSTLTEGAVFKLGTEWVRGEEVGLLLLILMLWVGAITLFINR